MYGTENVIFIPLPNNQKIKLKEKTHSETDVVFDNRRFPIFVDIAKYDTPLFGAVSSNASFRKQMKIATQNLG